MPDWKRILIHHSATHDGPGADYPGIRRYHVEVNNWNDIGYHAVVEKVADRYIAIPGRPLTVQGAHCPGQNNVALGMCLVGNFELEAPPDGQLDEAASILAGWCIRFGIDVTEIKTHREFRETACPGSLFPINDLRARVARILAEG